MVTDEFAEEDFVLVDRIGLSERELDGCRRAKRVALSFAGRIRISARHNRAVRLGTIRATRGR